MRNLVYWLALGTAFALLVAPFAFGITIAHGVNYWAALGLCLTLCFVALASLPSESTTGRAKVSQGSKNKVPKKKACEPALSECEELEELVEYYTASLKRLEANREESWEWKEDYDFTEQLLFEALRDLDEYWRKRERPYDWKAERRRQDDFESERWLAERQAYDEECQRRETDQQNQEACQRQEWESQEKQRIQFEP